ncbi:hypothetical protein MCC10050_1412 [Bifidobacterium longum subsp. longum]|uniref:Uncharacterized protein n=1 Tax=Bifidobacterium longum subsp. longum TaxID=1679 RepID=A0A4R0SME0_BIFLL|nr:hypothetical protein MCC10007_1502 [Bifidobacterium longum subsp. longum]TCD84854.1 hypothetical protein MCC10009_1581 [Bifidobacterium longum subsp. longum]TCE17009.1 hypothetical protein MCC10029_1526 [Bifidobacterium longum subsp. longum]TCE18734.1 hypothetical protein MCC10030_1572 [Bifidobacterium longum subsp. longum]TCE23137.1 hypothetical protein MCC10033_1532 [Bifidobacterium longum subsp. longum]
MLIPSLHTMSNIPSPSLSRRVNANSQLSCISCKTASKLIKKGEC